MNAMPSSGNREYVIATMTRALAWAEVFVLIPLHAFWVVFKSTPFAAENRASLLVLLVPAGAMILAGLATRRRSFRKAVIRAEWLFHLTSASFLSLLLAYVTLRDPFNPVAPITWPFCIWNAGIAFTLLANLSLHERTRDTRASLASPRGTLGACVVGILVWLALVPLAASMAWAPYFWTASAVFHSIMVPVSRRNANGAQFTDAPLGRLCPALTDTFEGLLASTIVMIALIRLLFVCDMVGAAEVRYSQLVTMGVTPWFVAGLALVALARAFKIPLLGHALVLCAVFFLPDAAPAIPFLMGYGLAVLFSSAMRSGAVSYAVLSTVTGFVWLLGLLGFMLAGVIIVFQVGAGLAESLLVKTRIALLLLSGVWLFLVVLKYWLSRRKPMETACKSTHPGPLPYGWAYAAAWLVILVPMAALLGLFMWPPVFFARPPQIAVGEASGICHAGYAKSPEEYAVLHELGARLTRIPVYWGQLEPEPGKWDFREPDAFLDAANTYGVKVVAALGFDNNAAEQSVTGKLRGAYLAPEDLPLFLEYVRRTVDRYRDRVHAWEIWNEPDLPHFWTGTMDEFYVVARETAATIREVHPQARIIGTAMTSLLGLYSTPGIEGLHSTGALEHVDHPAMHTYVSDPRAFYNEFRRVQNAAKKHGHPGSVWITELGAPDGGVYPWSVATGLRADYAMKAYAIATSTGIEKLFWHCYLDAAAETKRREPLNSEHFFGLVEPSGQWKPAAFAYRLFAKHCNNSTIRMDLVEATGGLAARQLRSALYRRDGGHSALVIWFEPGLRPGARARVTLEFGALHEPAIVHDLASGYSKLLVDGIIDVSEKPVFITFTAPDSEATVCIHAESSPADAAWLLLLAGLVGAVATVACRRAACNDMDV